MNFDDDRKKKEKNIFDGKRSLSPNSCHTNQFFIFLKVQSNTYKF